MRTTQKNIVCFFRQCGASAVMFLPVMAALMMVGCSSNLESIELANLQPVTGKVTFRGQPPLGAVVELVPKNGMHDEKKMSAFGVVAADGGFDVITVVPEGSRKGAQPGLYAVTISWTKPLDPNDKDSGRSADLLPQKYKSTNTSGLQCEIKSGRNEVPPFELVP